MAPTGLVNCPAHGSTTPPATLRIETDSFLLLLVGINLVHTECSVNTQREQAAISTFLNLDRKSFIVENDPHDEQGHDRDGQVRI